MVGAYPKYKSGLIDLKTAAVFGSPSIIAVFLTRKVLVPAIPATLFEIAGVSVSKALAMMILFAVLMVAASVSMIRDKKNEEQATDEPRVFNYPMILLEGAVVGVLTGLVGAGGGFLIIPALVMLSKLPMKQAVGTSLLIIAAKSLIGFTGDVMVNADHMDWTLLSVVTALAVVGIFVGNQLSKKIDGSALKKGFGWCVLVMGIYIIAKELAFLGAVSY
ncbi:MAG: sulfite exporter TauE/SafE family protein, partial [Flavobacteriia bacterium]